jgi:hypothetical protein
MLFGAKPKGWEGEAAWASFTVEAQSVFTYCYLLFHDPYPFVDVILDVSVEYIRTVILYEQVSNQDNLEEGKITLYPSKC